ncbi:MAG TPA: tetratricopeptide repeat protein, partial [Planctomycetota bacterium]|nr:tetratricopeptide repeat protein [Planctomycetota bacterium]
MERVTTIFLATLAAVLGASIPAAAQDKDRVRVSENGAVNEYSGTIKAINCNKVTAAVETPDDPKPKQRDFDADAVLEITLSSERKTDALVEGEQAYNLGNYAEAIDHFAKAVKDAGKDDVQKQLAHFLWGSTAYQARQWAKAIEILRTLVKEMSDSWYCEKAFKLMYDAAMANRDPGTASAIIDEFAAAGRSKSKGGWAKMSELLKADMLENQGKAEEAGRLFGKYSR